MRDVSGRVKGQQVMDLLEKRDFAAINKMTIDRDVWQDILGRKVLTLEEIDGLWPSLTKRNRPARFDSEVEVPPLPGEPGHFNYKFNIGLIVDHSHLADDQ